MDQIYHSNSPNGGVKLCAIFFLLSEDNNYFIIIRFHFISSITPLCCCSDRELPRPDPGTCMDHTLGACAALGHRTDRERCIGLAVVPVHVVARCGNLTIWYLNRSSVMGITRVIPFCWPICTSGAIADITCAGSR